MLLHLILGPALPPPQTYITRDDYGVAHISAPTVDDAWRAAGYAVAQDRLWQMELSRRLSRGRMAEMLGPQYATSDKEVLQTGYTDAELQQQIDDLGPDLKRAFSDYADGINDFIAEGHLPPQFGAQGIKPDPWSPLDSAAIAIRLLQYFGRGGAGAIRNMAVAGYLQGRKPIEGKLLDVMDDFLWQNDPSSPTTIAKEDESPNHPTFTAPSHEATARQMAALPKLGLLEMLPGLQLASRETTTRAAERMALPFHTGSYCMVVDAKHSGTGAPALLSGPQMGFTNPSIVHEMSMHAPGLDVVGMDIPGSPGIVIGHNRHIAWGLTSGVADTDDIVYFEKQGGSSYKYGSEARTTETISRSFHVKGSADQTVEEVRTVDGPAVLNTRASNGNPGYLFARHSSYRMKELQSFAAFAGLYVASTAEEADKAGAKGTMSFNLFFAADNGEIGYRYAGLVPNRNQELDPRFPVPGDPKNEWKGMIASDQMPHVIEPKCGLLTNWNNKPVSWWPNLDTPVWGRIFRVDAIRRVLEKSKPTAQEFELAAWTIARTDETWPFFKQYVQRAVDKLRQDPATVPVALSIAGFEGHLMDGSRQATVYRSFISELRKLLFLPNVGNFMQPDYFNQVAQPSVMLAALDGRTKFSYLAGRRADDVVIQALKTAYGDGHGPRYKAPTIPVSGEDPIPYSNRGTYIQVVELLPDGPLGRNVLPPGVAEDGPHSKDQANLSRAWVYKPMHRPWEPEK